MKDVSLRGVIPANLLPFNEDLGIDEATLRRHIEYLAGTRGVAGITTNGHAAEVATLDADERRRSLAMTVETVAGRVPVVCGICIDGTANAVREARMAKQENADALLIFPSDIFQFGGSAHRPDMVYNHFAAIAEAADMPMVLFSYAQESGKSYPLGAILKICSDIPHVVAVKELSYDIGFYEALARELRTLSKPVSMLTSFSKHLLATLSIGADGMISGHGSIVPEMQVEIFEAVGKGDLFEARRVADRMWPIVNATYSAPGADMHNRMKYVAKKLGRFPCDAVRPPLMPLPEAERKRLDAAIAGSNLK